MEEFDKWISACSQQLGLTGEVDTGVLLDVARDVAHGVSRPATPVTTYLMGLAVGGGSDLEAVAAAVKALAAGWVPDLADEA